MCTLLLLPALDHALCDLHEQPHPELEYAEGQEPIIHLEADLRESIAWANDSRRRWAFTTSNAGSYYFEDFSDLNRLDKINWDAVNASKWSGSGVDQSVKEDKQAEFLVEGSFPWELVSRIGHQVTTDIC